MLTNKTSLLDNRLRTNFGLFLKIYIYIQHCKFMAKALVRFHDLAILVLMSSDVRFCPRSHVRLHGFLGRMAHPVPWDDIIPPIILQRYIASL